MDPKPAKRIIDRDAGPLKLASDSACRGCKKRATDPHHILLRSQRGDDVEDNIMPLCHLCHIDYHEGRLKGLRLTVNESAYLEMKLGKDAAKMYIGRRYA
jgi:hypothetical protein